MKQVALADESLTGSRAQPERCRTRSGQLWLGLGEPRRAFEVIKHFDPRDRGLYKILVAKSLSKTGNAQEASAMALEAANDSFDALDYERLLMTVELLVEMNRLDLARQITAKADQQSEGQGPFRPFNISAVGEMYAWTGDLQACLRLQAKALGVASTKGEVIAWGLVSGPIGYSSSGMFDLGPQLRQNAAARSIRCGDRGAMKEIDNRRLARNYCDYYRRGLVKPEYLGQRPQKRIDSDAPRSLLFEHAAECHFELERAAKSRRRCFSAWSRMLSLQRTFTPPIQQPSWRVFMVLDRFVMKLWVWLETC